MIAEECHQRFAPFVIAIKLTEMCEDDLNNKVIL